jgi:DNA-binding transcriptional MerR regulator
MFRIGEFAQIAQVSCRLLRYYEELGLLSPAHTDTVSGYRFYTARQLPELNRILALKELGFPLAEIRSLLASAIEPQELRAMLLRMKAQREESLRQHLDSIRNIESRIRQIEEHGTFENYDVVLKSTGPQPFMSIRSLCDGMAAALRLVETVRIHGGSSLRAGIRDKLVVLAYPGFDGDLLDLEVGFSLTRRTNNVVRLPDGTSLSLNELPAAEAMTTLVRTGPVHESHLAFGAVALWIEMNGYLIDGPCREVFLELPEPRVGNAEPVVEIQYPIRKVA